MLMTENLYIHNRPITLVNSLQSRKEVQCPATGELDNTKPDFYRRRDSILAEIHGKLLDSWKVWVREVDDLAETNQGVVEVESVDGGVLLWHYERGRLNAAMLGAWQAHGLTVVLGDWKTKGEVEAWVSWCKAWSRVGPGDMFATLMGFNACELSYYSFVGLSSSGGCLLCFHMQALGLKGGLLCQGKSPFSRFEVGPFFCCSSEHALMDLILDSLSFTAPRLLFGCLITSLTLCCGSDGTFTIPLHLHLLYRQPWAASTRLFRVRSL